MQPKKVNVVTVFLEHDRKILLLRRSQKASTMKGLWAGISGYIENNDALTQALKEIEEETGLSNKKLTLLHVGQPLEVVEANNPDTVWVVHPYLFHSNTSLIRIDCEHDELRWINPNEIQSYETVPKLKEAFENCLRN
ncbi:MAG: NUDIX domain-containing protein [Nitrososphaeraceae archaeon]